VCTDIRLFLPFLAAVWEGGENLLFWVSYLELIFISRVCLRASHCTFLPCLEEGARGSALNVLVLECWKVNRKLMKLECRIIIIIIITIIQYSIVTNFRMMYVPCEHNID
jgi:hypothetical protein